MELKIIDGDIVSWRPIYNSAARRNGGRDHFKDQWAGVLVQVGKYTPLDGRCTGDRFTKVEFLDAGGGQILARGRAFGWINIVPVHDSTKRSDPVPKSAGALKKYLRKFCETKPRRSFEPFGVITAWVGPGGYQMTCKEREGDDPPFRIVTYSFSFNDETRVFIEEEELASTGLVKEIRLGSSIDGGPLGGGSDPGPRDP